MSRARRNPPFSRAETLSKARVRLVTLWPFLLAALVLLLDCSAPLHRTRLSFSATHCSTPLQCYVSSSSRPAVTDRDRDGSSESERVVFTLPAQAFLLRFVNLVGRLQLRLPADSHSHSDSELGFQGSAIALRFDVAFNLYAQDALGQRTQTLIENFHMNKEIDVVVQSEGAEKKHAGRRREKQFEYDYELGSASLERPWLLPDSRNIQGEVEVTVTYSGGEAPPHLTLEQRNLFNLVVQDYAHSVLQGSSIVLEYQSELYAFIKALFQVAASIFTLLYLFDYVRRLKLYHQVLYDHSVLPLDDTAHVVVEHAKSTKSSPSKKSSTPKGGEAGVKSTESLDESNTSGIVEYESLSVSSGQRRRAQFGHSSSTCSVGSVFSHVSGVIQEDYNTTLLKNIADSPSNRFYFISFLLAEQIYTVVLLVFLFLWMDPLGAFVVLLPLSSAVTVNETALWISDLMKSSAQQGLYFTLLLFLTSLGTVATPYPQKEYLQALESEIGTGRIGTGSQHTSLSSIKDRSFSVDSNMDDPTGALSWLSPPKRPSPHRSSSDKKHCASSKKWDTYGSFRQDSRIPGQATPPPQSLDSSIPRLPSWVYEPDGGQETVTSGSTDVRKSQISAKKNSLVCDTSSPDDRYNKNHPSWVDSPSSYQAVRPISGEGGGKTGSPRSPELICRSYIDTPLDDKTDLIASHPCSSKFLSFFGYKFLFYMFCLVIVAFQVFVTYPTLSASVIMRLPSMDKYSALLVERALFVVLSIALVICRLTWIGSIYKATVSSALKLKETKYMNSRYQQLAFRLFLNQILVGLALLLLSYLILAGRSVLMIYHGYKHDLAAEHAAEGGEMPSFDGGDEVRIGSGRRWTSIAGLWHELYIIVNACFEEGFGVWGGKNSELGELIYVACICYTIAFLFSPPLHGSELEALRLDDDMDEDDCPPSNLYLQNDLGLAGHTYDYDVLEQNSDLTDSLSVLPTTTPLCLETALLLMECSWQTYYITPPEHDDDEEHQRTIAALPPARIPSSFKYTTSEFQPLLSSQTSISSEDGNVSPTEGSSLEARMDVAQYGLKLVKSFCNPGGDIAGFVARDDYTTASSRIILSFRGTADTSNMLTDLNFFQTTVEKLMLNLESKSIEALVDEVANDIRQAKKALTKKKKSPRSSSASTNPFAGDDNTGASNSRCRDKVSRRISINPFGEDSDDDDGDRTPRTSVGGISTIGEECCPVPLVAADGTKLHQPSRAQLPDPVPTIAPMRSCPCCFPSVTQRKHPRVHTGFYLAYLSIRTVMYKAIIEAITHCLDRKRIEEDDPFCDAEERERLLARPLDIQICGHSLGGALATLASLDLSLNLRMVMQIVQLKTNSRRNSDSKLTKLSTLPQFRLLVFSFGSPRVGNKAFTRWLGKQVPCMFRVEVDGDLVCRVPHVMYTCGSYHHAGNHVFVAADRTGNFMINPTVVEKHFLRRGTGTSDHHSLTQYRACVEACFSPEELQYVFSKYNLRGQHLQ